jgi:hypothetical protein
LEADDISSSSSLSDEEENPNCSSAEEEEPDHKITIDYNLLWIYKIVLLFIETLLYGKMIKDCTMQG